jgi:nicotinate-nucleotide adenylyltransferase
VLAAQYVLLVGEVARVCVVPVFEHALQKELTAFPIRERLCRAAFQGDDRIFVDDIESRLPRPSFTLQTLEALRSKHPGATLRLMIGADVLLDAHKWHRFDEVCRLAPPLVLGRAGVTGQAAPPAVLPEVSSSEIRALIKRGDPEARQRLAQLTPKSVRELMVQEGLYR